MSTGRKSDSVLIQDRRGSPRQDRCEELTLGLDPDDGQTIRTIQAWSCNVSSNGVRFRCRETLPDEILVQFPSGFTVEGKVVYCTEAGDGVWDYGVHLATPLPEDLDVCRPRGDAGPEGRFVEVPAARPTDRATRTVLCLRELTSDAETWRRRSDAMAMLAVAGFMASTPLLIDYSNPEMFFCVIGFAVVSTVGWLVTRRAGQVSPAN